MSTKYLQLNNSIKINMDICLEMCPCLHYVSINDSQSNLLVDAREIVEYCEINNITIPNHFVYAINLPPSNDNILLLHR